MANFEFIPADDPKKEKGKRAVIYARYSSAKQNALSIEQQLGECMAYIKYKGYEHIATYIDRAKSASHDINKRKDFLRMLEDAESNEFDVVVAYSVDRISRDESGAFYEYERSLNENGVRLEYSSQHFGDEDDDTYQLIKNISVGSAQMYVTKLRRDTVRGMSHNAEEGLYTGGGSIPMGYTLTEGTNGKRKKYIIDKEKAPFVKEAFSMYLSGKSTKDIAEFLTDKGFRTIHGNNITYDNVNRMLENPIYKGVRITKFDNKRLKGNYVAKNACKGIITEDEWNQVQIEKKKRSHSGETEAHRETYILRGKLFCGLCGAEMVAHKGKSYYYYVCKERKNRKTGDPKRCKKENVSKQALEDTVIDIITNHVWDEGAVKFYIEAAKKAEATKIVNPQIKELEESIKKHKAKKKLAMETFLETEDTDYKEAAANEARIIKNEEETLKALNRMEANSMTAEQFEHEVREIQKVWEKLCRTSDGRISVINNFIDKIYLYDPEDPNDPSKVKIKLIMKPDSRQDTGDEISAEIDISQLENDDARVTNIKDLL